MSELLHLSVRRAIDHLVEHKGLNQEPVRIELPENFFLFYVVNIGTGEYIIQIFSQLLDVRVPVVVIASYPDRTTLCRGTHSKAISLIRDFLDSSCMSVKDKPVSETDMQIAKVLLLSGDKDQVFKAAKAMGIIRKEVEETDKNFRKLDALIHVLQDLV